MPGRIGYSTAARSANFLEWAWRNREEMALTTQRQGLSQAIYASLLAHIEAVMFMVLESEYRSMALAVNAHVQSSDDQITQRLDGMTLQVLADKRQKLENMTFESLFQELEQLLHPKFLEPNGPRRHKPDLDAIRILRNQFVHGRDIWMPLTPDVEPGTRIDTDGTKIKAALDRLVTAKILSRSETVTRDEANGSGQLRLFEKLHSDPAVLHFVEVARTFQRELLEISPSTSPLFAYEFPQLELHTKGANRLPPG